MSELVNATVKGRKKAVVYMTAPTGNHRRYCDVPDESSTLYDQREAIKRKAAELNADIVGEFLIPRLSRPAAKEPLFRQMLNDISTQSIDYVIIYPRRINRIRERNMVITEVINQAGARVVSVSDMTGLTGYVDSILQMLSDLQTADRRDAQLRRKWKRQQNAA